MRMSIKKHEEKVSNNLIRCQDFLDYFSSVVVKKRKAAGILLASISNSCNPL